MADTGEVVGRQAAGVACDEGPNREAGEVGGVGLGQVMFWVLVVHGLLFGGMYAHHRVFGDGARGAAEEVFGPRPDAEAVVHAPAGTNAGTGDIPTARMGADESVTPGRWVAEAGSAGVSTGTESPSVLGPVSDPIDGDGPGAAVPAAEAAVAEATPEAGRAHLVRRGETLWRIARQYGVSVDSLREANGLSGDQIRVGQALQIPGAPDPVGPSPVAAQGPGEGNQHVVARGDTLFGIARRYGVTADALARANGIADPRKVRVGARLMIPR